MRFSEDKGVVLVRDLVHLEGGIVVGKEMFIDIPACVRRAVGSMLYADKAGVVSKSA